MRSTPVLVLFALLIEGLGASAPAQQPIVPVHKIGAVVATSTDSISSLASVRVLSDGRVLINDAPRRRLIMLEATLQHPRILADTTVATNRAYGSGLSAMIRFAGDSTLIQDDATAAFIVVDPAGTFARLLPAPRAAGNPQGFGPTPPIGVDHDGRLIYRALTPFFGPVLPQSFQGDTSVIRADSSAVRRVNPSTWRSDTVTKLQIPRTRDFITRSLMSSSTRSAVSPIPSGDDIAVLDDGTLALVRVRDYHIDFIESNGRVTSGLPIPIPWVALSQKAKVMLLDSLRVRDSVGDARIVAAAVARGEVPFTPNRAYVLPGDLPDTQPPFVSGFTRADADGRLWILVSRSVTTGAPVFDLIDRRGTRVDRVELPAGATLVGFAPETVYYSLPMRPSQPGKPLQLVAARIH